MKTLDPIPVLIDTDPGVDDALALAFALRSGWYDVRAITVVAGNCPVDRGVENAFRMLEAAATGVAAFPPVYRGAERPLAVPHTGAEHVHGSDGMGGIAGLKDGSEFRYPSPKGKLQPGHAVEAILAALNHAPGEVTVVTLGPLTNLALAAMKDPAALAKAKRIVCMAGAFRVPGNVTPVAEYNVWADPDACLDLLRFAGKWLTADEDGLPRLRFVGLDATHQVFLTRRDLEDWSRGKGEFGRFLLDLTASTMAFHRDQRGLDGLYLHDPLAALLAARPGLCEFEALPVQVECEGSVTLGMTVADRRGWKDPQGVPVAVCQSVNAEEALEAFRDGLFE